MWNAYRSRLRVVVLSAICSLGSTATSLDLEHEERGVVSVVDVDVTLSPHGPHPFTSSPHLLQRRLLPARTLTLFLVVFVVCHAWSLYISRLWHPIQVQRSQRRPLAPFSSTSLCLRVRLKQFVLSLIVSLLQYCWRNSYYENYCYTSGSLFYVLLVRNYLKYANFPVFRVPVFYAFQADDFSYYPFQWYFRVNKSYTLLRTTSYTH